MASIFGMGGEGDWQQYYSPFEGSGQVGGYSQEYVNDVNSARLREAKLMAQQQAQASNVTASQDMTLAQMSQNQAYLDEMRGNMPKPGTFSGGTGTGTGGTGAVGGMPAPYSNVYGPSTVTSVGGGGLGGMQYGGIQSASEQTRYDPWSEHRGTAADELGGTIGQPSPSDVYQQKLAQMASGQFSPDDPSYQWRYNQGQQAVERSMAAKGLLNSGNAAIELQQYGQGAASQEYGAQFNRMLQGLTGVETAYDAQMGRLMKMAGVDIDPTAGGKLNVAQGQLGVEGGRLGLDAQGLANDWYLRNRELGLKEQLAYQSMLSGSVGGMGGSDWSAIFNTGSR